MTGSNTTPLDEMLVNQRLPPPPKKAFHQASLTECLYLLILLGGERHCECQVSWPIAQHNDSARPQTETGLP